MVRERFDDAFERLRDQSNRLAETERGADNFDEIVAQRVELDRLRDEVVAERKHIVSRFEPPATDVVLPPRGHVHTKVFGKIAAAVSVGLLVVAATLVVGIVQEIGEPFPLVYAAIDETIDADGCLWTVVVTLRNDSETSVEVTRMVTVLDRRLVGATPASYPTLDPGATATATGTWRLSGVDPCPAPADVDHGNLIVHLDNGTTVSRGF